MKSIHKILGLTAVLSMALFSCDENDGIRSANATVANPSSNNANFFFINATTGGPSLDFFVNGVNLGTADLGAGLTGGYKNVAITTPGLNNIANTSIRAKATTGSIGGTLGTNDLIFRATNTGIGNLVAAPNARYTFIAVDEIDRPQPLRTFSVNPNTKALAADITYYNRINKKQVSNDDYNNPEITPVSERPNFVSIGTIPAGVSDPGGARFYVITDSYPTDAAIAAAVTANQAFIRFVHASPNAPGVFVRLVPTVGGADINVVTTAAVNVMSVAGGFSPSAGSRTATAPSFSTITIGAASNSYTVEVHTTPGFTALALAVPNVTLQAGKVYTVVARGLVGGTGASALGASVGVHN
ncbi:MAG: hypothetical protein ACK5BJ_01585 [Bacteroidota bacterium]|nr:DUF4397 domain-containing protein [Cytophagales bacterium]MCA6500728.1 DUF4397 domain-containing protein [Chitinophagaceae bacterium]